MIAAFLSFFHSFSLSAVKIFFYFKSTTESSLIESGLTRKEKLEAKISPLEGVADVRIKRGTGFTRTYSTNKFIFDIRDERTRLSELCPCPRFSDMCVSEVMTLPISESVSEVPKIFVSVSESASDMDSFLWCMVRTIF